MKRFILLTMGLSVVLLASSAKAGVNYIQYHEQFDAEKKQCTKMETGEKSLKHMSKYSQEQRQWHSLPTGDHIVNDQELRNRDPRRR